MKGDNTPNARMNILIDGEQVVVARTGDESFEQVIGLFWIGKITMDSEVVIKIQNGTANQNNAIR